MSRSVSGIHLARHIARLVGWETLEEDQFEMCSPNAQTARPARSLSLLALSALSLAKPKFIYSRLAS